MAETFGGIFWDCLLLCDYKGFADFYLIGEKK